MWLLGTRNWELTNDFTYVLNGNKYVIPAALNLMVLVYQNF